MQSMDNGEYLHLSGSIHCAPLCVAQREARVPAVLGFRQCMFKPLREP